MSKTIRKIELMHRQFGITEGKTCKDCSNLHKREWSRRYYKCRVYGMSQAESTDWRLSYNACGLFNKEWHGGEIVRLVHSTFDRVYEDQPIEGQYTFEDIEARVTNGDRIRSMSNAELKKWYCSARAGEHSCSGCPFDALECTLPEWLEAEAEETEEGDDE